MKNIQDFSIGFKFLFFLVKVFYYSQQILLKVRLLQTSKHAA